MVQLVRMGYNIVTNLQICDQITQQLMGGNLSLLYFAHLPVMVISLLVGCFVLIKDRKDIVARIFFLFSLTFSCWTFFNFITWVSSDSRLIMFSWSLLGIFAGLFYVLSLYFAFVFIDKKDISFLKKVLLMAPILPIIILTPTAANLGNFDVRWCGADDNLFFGYVYIPQIISIVWLFVFCIKRYLAATGDMRKEIGIFLTGLSLFLLTFLGSGFIADIYQLYHFEVYGLFAMVIFLFFLAYLIVQYQAFQIKLFGAQVLVFVLAILIASQFAFIQDPTNRVLNGITLVLVSIFGYFLARSVRSEIQQREEVSHLADMHKDANEELYKKGAELAARNKTLSLLDSMYQVATKSVDIEQTSHELAQEVSKTLGVPYVSIIIYHPDDKSLELTGYAEHGQSAAGFEKNLRVTDTAYFGFRVLQERRAVPVPPSGVLTGVFFPKQDRKKHLIDLGVVGTVVYPLFTEQRPIGLLIIGLNRAIGKLSAFEREGVASAVNVVSVALDKALAFEDLRAANTKLLELDQLKTEFISIASHQLRTPLSIIKGYVSLMQEGAYGKMPKKSEPILQNIDESNERLVKLVDDFLDVSRLEQGRTQYSFAPLNITTLVEGIVTELNNKAEKKNMHITLEMGKKIPESIIADEERIRHGIFNYVDNAIKYSPDGTTVTVTVSAETDRIVCAVRDQGVGMDADDIRNLFQKFYRSPKVLREFQGTGLGLFVVKEFIEAHGGQVYAKSDGVGKGSEFGFWVPLVPTGEIYETWKSERAPELGEKK